MHSVVHRSFLLLSHVDGRMGLSEWQAEVQVPVWTSDRASSLHSYKVMAGVSHTLGIL